MEEFDSNVTTKRRVGCAVDLAHPTFPNERTKGISTETYAGLDFHWAFCTVMLLVGLGFWK